LGLNLLGNVQPPAVAINGPGTGFFEKYGHNVSYEVLDFYNANGGEAVFGQPLTELQNATGYLTQYFENVVFTIQYNLPPDQRVQVLNLGQHSLAAQAIPIRTSPPQLLVVTTQPLLNAFDPAVAEQTLTARVQDETGLAVAGAQARFIVRTPAGDMEFTGTTDFDGYASYRFNLSSYNPGDYMLYDVKVTYGGLSGSASAAFVTWGKPTP
jgi:hypothetical protein